MTTQIIITLAVLCVVMGMFAWNRVPAAAVAMGASLGLYFAGILTAPEFIHGVGDSVVILIAALLVIATGLEMAGVSAWAGQLLINHTGASSTGRVVLIMLVAGVFTSLIGMNGAVASMLPVILVVAIRTQEQPSKLMIPLAFACLTASKITLLGTPVNVIALVQAEEAGAGHIGFFEWSVLGVPLLLGTIAIVILLGRFLLPERRSRSIPPDLSSHAYTLVEQYRLQDGLHHLRVRESSPYVGTSRSSITLDAYPGLSLVGLFDGEARPLQRERVQEGDILLVRGEADLVSRLATDAHLAIREDAKAVLPGKLMNRELGLAEVIIPARSKLIGQSVFPGMMTEDGGLMILAIQRAGEEMPQAPTTVQAGDHLLLQGTWKALDQYLGDPQVMVVDSIEVLQKQAVALGKGARRHRDPAAARDLAGLQSRVCHCRGGAVRDADGRHRRAQGVAGVSRHRLEHAHPHRCDDPARDRDDQDRHLGDDRRLRRHRRRRRRTARGVAEYLPGDRAHHSVHFEHVLGAGDDAHRAGDVA